MTETMIPEIKIDIAICTFRRPHIECTLRSLTALILPAGVSINVIVADNDDTKSAQKLVMNTASACNLSVTYLHAPSRNISIARNACLNNATAPLLAFIDDDELVEPQWLSELLSTMNNTKADVVLGPVKAVYSSACPEWLIEADFHSTHPVWVNGNIITGYGGNVLMKRTAPCTNGLRFRIDLGRSGGEDTVFFSTVYNMGGKIAYAEKALITEMIPDERASLGWLAKRRFRAGQTHGTLLMEKARQSVVARIHSITLAFAKMLYSAAFIPLWWMDKKRGAFWILRTKLHAGVAAQLLGAHAPQIYGQEH